MNRQVLARSAEAISPRRIWALARKEFLQVVRDPSSILIAFVLPLILLFIFGYGISLDSEHVRIGVAVEDSGREAASLARAFFSTKYFAAEGARSRRELEDKLVAGELRGLIVIPVGFSADFQRNGSQASFQVISDGSEPNTSSFVENYAQGAYSAWLRQQGLESAASATGGVSLQPRFWFNSELASRDSLLPGCLTLIMAIIGTLLTALVVAREWERGTMEALMATPVRAEELIIGKLLPYFLLGMGAMIFSTFAACLVFGLPFRGSVGALLLVSSAFLLVSLALGLLISTIAKSQFVAAQAAVLAAFLPATLLSGFIFEIASMPWLLRVITNIVPARHFVPPLQTIFLAGDIWPVIAKGAGVLFLMAFVLLALTLRKSAKRLE